MSNLTINTILQSKIYVKENSPISFGSPGQYIEPFLEKLKDTGATYRVAVSDRVANRETTGQTNEAYGRVLIEAKMPNEFCAYEHDSVIGMVYALDTQKPSIKVYSGENAWACTNLSIFGARYIHNVELLQGTASIYEKAMEYVDGIAEQIRRFKNLYERMNEKYYQDEEINTMVGYLLREGLRNKNIGSTPILAAVNTMEDSKSKYAIRDNRTSQWNMYNAVTQYITDKCDIADKASKTVMIGKLFVSEV
jgi:hypothetical protein